MSEIIGRNLEVGFALEQSRGVAETVAEKWLKNIKVAIWEKADHAIDESNHNVLEDSDNRRVVKKIIEGDIEGNVHADALGFLLYNLYGAVQSTLVTGSIYTHVFTMDQDIQHPSLSLFCKDGGIVQKVYSEGMIDNLELTADIDKIISFKAAVCAKSGASNSDTPSYEATEYDFVTKDITIKMADSEAGLSGATAQKVKSLSIKFDQGTIKDHTFGSYNPNGLYNSKMSIEGSMKVNYEDTSFKDLYLGEASKYVQITIEGSQDLGSGNKPTITILLYKMMVVDWKHNDDRDKLIDQDVDFKAFYNSVDSKQSQITLKNVTSEYDEPLSA